MKAWLIQIKREFWEHQTLFLIIPLAIAGLIVIAGTYVVVMHSSLNSRMGMSLFGHVYYIDAGTDTSSGKPAVATNREAPDEYIIDFSREALIKAEGSDKDISRPDARRRVTNAALYGFHSFIMLVTGIVLIFYQLNCLYADRRDRSILFWKSMPVSELRNVSTKLIVSMLAVPLLATLISWGIQLCYLVLSSIFVYRVGSSPWEMVWGQLDLIHLFPQELILFLWCTAWWIPLAAWLLFSSALGKRSPFLVAVVPLVVVIIMDNLLSGSWHVGNMLLQHFRTALYQGARLTGEASDTGQTTGAVNIFLDAPAMITGFVIAGLLFPATVWLRNHRFEI